MLALPPLALIYKCLRSTYMLGGRSQQVVSPTSAYRHWGWIKKWVQQSKTFRMPAAVTSYRRKRSRKGGEKKKKYCLCLESCTRFSHRFFRGWEIMLFSTTYFIKTKEELKSIWLIIRVSCLGGVFQLFWPKYFKNHLKSVLWVNAWV